MDKDKKIFLVPTRYTNHTGIGYPLSEEGAKEEAKQKDRLKEIEDFLQKNQIKRQNAVKPTIEEELTISINQLIEMQNNLSDKYDKSLIILSCEKIAKRIMRNEILVNIIEENSKDRGGNLGNSIQNTVRSFASCDYIGEIRYFLIRFREYLVELFDLYIEDLELVAEVTQNIVNICNKNESKAKRIRDLANKDPNLTYAQIAIRIETTENYVKKVMNKKSNLK